MKYVVLILILSLAVFSLYKAPERQTVSEEIVQVSARPSPAPSLPPTPAPLPSAHMVTGGTQVFQTFNNCGPASLSMALSYYDIQVSQKEIGDRLRPWQNAQGDNDDKSVTLEELAGEAERYGLAAYYRPAGNSEMVKRFISLGLPVITRTWLKVNDDIGHYRVVKGYDENGIVQDDSLQGKDLRYSWQEFDAIWSKFNYEYVVLVPKERIAQVEAILGEDVDETEAWDRAVGIAEEALGDNPGDVSAGLNLAVALYRVGEYERSAEEFRKVRSSLPKRALWYQIEPILSLFELGRDDEVLGLTESIINGENRAFTELYILRGKIYLKRGQVDLARKEFEKAAFYNKNSLEAQKELASLSVQ